MDEVVGSSQGPFQNSAVMNPLPFDLQNGDKNTTQMLLWGLKRLWLSAGRRLSAKYHYYSLQIWALLSASISVQGWKYCPPRRSPEKADSTPL